MKKFNNFYRNDLKLTFILLSVILFFWTMFYMQFVWAYNPNLSTRGDFGSGTVNNASIKYQPGTGTTGGTDSARFKIFYGTQSCTGTGTQGYITSTTGLPFVDYMYSNGSSTYSLTGFTNIYTDGNVGIGTTTPGARLCIEDANPIITLNGTGGGQASYIKAGVGIVTSSITCGTTNFTVNNNANSANLFVVTDSGAVNIGTTTSDGTALKIIRGNQTHNLGIPGISVYDGADSQLYLGYDDDIQAGYINALQSGVSWKNIVLCSPGGKVSIGTTTPQALLDVNGSSAFGTATDRLTIDAFGNLSDSGSQVYINDDLYVANTSQLAGNIKIGTATGNRIFGLNSGMSYILGASGGCAVRFIVDGANDEISFETHKSGVSHAEAMRIASNQYVGIGTTTPSTQLHTTGGVRFGTLGAGAVQSDAGGNLSVVSDERMKDIQGTFTASVSEILGINPILYKWNKLSGLEMENCYAGFSAQNVKKYIPEAIGVDANGYYSFNDRPVVAALVNCIKELQKEIDELKVKTGIEIHEYKIEPCKDIERCVKTSDIALRETPRLAGEETHEYIEKKEDSEYKWNYQMKEGFRYDSSTRQFYRKESFEEARDRKNKTIREGL